MNKNLFLITEDFPFGIGEAFLENEIDFLSESFKKIFIISKGNSNLEKRQVSKNVLIFNYSPSANIFSKLFSLKYLFTKIFIDEFSNTENLSFKKIAYCLKSLYNANNFKKFLINRFSDDDLNNSLIYTYWCMDETIAVCLLEDFNIKRISRTHGFDLYFERSESNYLPLRKFISERLDAIFPISKQNIFFESQVFQN